MSDRPANYSYDSLRFPYFEQPFPTKRFSDVMYEVSGRTRAENHLITTAQAEFLSNWLKDKHMRARLEAWEAIVGFPEIINDIAAFLDRVADRYSLTHRRHLLRNPRPSHVAIEDLLPEWHVLQDRLYTTYRRSSEVRDAACTYVRDELRQPWPWLAYQLTNHVFEQAHDCALGVTPIRFRTSYLDDHIHGPYVQPFEYTFKAKPGELVDEARKRLDAEYAAVRANIQPRETKQQSLPKGNVRPDRELKTQRNTKWLYLYLIGKEHGPKISMYSMAKSFHIQQQKHRQHKKFPKCSCQGDVRAGIKSTQALLNLTPWRF
jgi:hypothetical protein